MGPEKVEQIIQYITIRRKRETLTQKGLLAPAKFPNKQESQLVKVGYGNSLYRAGWKMQSAWGNAPHRNRAESCGFKWSRFVFLPYYIIFLLLSKE